jgi:NAD(P)-dependent dehydrogenase (short-subunit alcohol dehydrogenase family)
MQLKDKVVLITGASGGLGTSVTGAFLDAGARVIGVSRAVSASDIPREVYFALAAELSSSEQARAMVETAASKWGRLDALVHLVGGFAGGHAVSETDDATFDKMLDLNLRSAFLVIRSVLPRMRAQQAGRIIAIASKAAAGPSPMAGIYGASKAALVSLIQTVSRENSGMGITANVILPGTMDTPANRTADPRADPAKWIQPRSVADLLVYLVSDAGAQISGTAIPVDGGQA